MTPEATIGLLHMLDHWHLMLCQMRGETLPPLPAIQGRQHLQPIPGDDLFVARNRQVLSDLRVAEIWRELAADTEGGSP